MFLSLLNLERFSKFPIEKICDTSFTKSMKFTVKMGMVNAIAFYIKRYIMDLENT